MHVYIYKESITDIKGMDAITNAANEKLMHGGGVAFYISKAAGRKMDQDCRTYIDKIGKLPVTHNYVSIPGDMKCKGIIHAVGPIWWNYKDRQDECARDLYETVKNVLKEVRTRGWRKVALSAISSGLFGVPKKLCAEMYMKAFTDFAAESPGTLKEVHFIDVSREILDRVIDAHKDWVKAPESLSFQNAFRYLSTATGAEKTKIRQDKRSDAADKSNPGIIIRFEGEGTTSYGERMFKYSIGDKLKLFVYNGSLTRLEIEAIGFPIGTTESQLIGGHLAKSVESLAGKSYRTSLSKQVREKQRHVIVSKETGRLKCQNIVHVVAPVLTDMSAKSLQVISGIYRLALTHDYSGRIKKLAMPLTGTGICARGSDIQRLCQCVVATVAGVCADTVQPQIREFHVVNNVPSWTLYIHNELKAAAVKALRVQVGQGGLRKGVVCGTYHDFIGKCREKFDLEAFTVTLEDGTEVDEEFFATVGSGRVLLLIAAEEEAVGPVRMIDQDVENEVFVPEPPVPLCTIQVKGPTDIIKQTEILELYFDNERKSHGGNVQEVRYDLEEDLAYVTFETEEAAKRVVEKTGHTVLRKHLSVQLFNPCKKAKQIYHYQVKAENTGEIQDPDCGVKVNNGLRYTEFESLMSDEVKDDD